MNLTIDSERLTLVPFGMTDIDIAIEMFTDPVVMKHGFGVMDEQAIKEDMPLWTRRGGDGFVGIWCVVDNDSGEKLGTTALLPMPTDSEDTDFDSIQPGVMPDAEIEIGYYLKRSAWGQGYATEACRSVVDAAFARSNLSQIVATFDTENEASRKVLIKSGFESLGQRRSYGEDGPYYRVTRTDWLLRA